MSDKPVSYIFNIMVDSFDINQQTTLYDLSNIFNIMVDSFDIDKPVSKDEIQIIIKYAADLVWTNDQSMKDIINDYLKNIGISIQDNKKINTDHKEKINEIYNNMKK